MSHSLHRYGSIEDLKNDYCIYARCAKGVNRDNPREKLRRILEIYQTEDFVNFGSAHAGKCYLDGLDPKQYAKRLDKAYGMIVSFSKKNSVENILRKLKDENIGISIIVSGLIDEIRDVAKKCGLKLHTATLSLGIYGNTSLLPKENTLKITTMCGHSLIGNRLVESIIEKVRTEKITIEDAALILAKPCVCGIFNTVRCSELICKQL